MAKDTNNLSKLSILVVEDSAAMQSLISAILREMGIRKIYMAYEGHKGYEFLQTENPDIVITDWLMEEGLDGISFTKKIRRDTTSLQRTVPIIMMSGFSVKKRVIEARDAGVTEFLAKPFTAEELAKRINHVIEHPRTFIQCATFCGPNRRRHRKAVYEGPMRRQADKHFTTQVYSKGSGEKGDKKPNKPDASDISLL